jgi:glycosyltransferase involved in cell wall biosynthesis
VTRTRSDFLNLEQITDFAIRWRPPGDGMFTAVLRVKNEAQSLPWVLPGVLRVADEVILVDNGSDDGTPEVAQRVAEGNGSADRFRVLEYPFQVSRCGSEHLATPPNSVHSLTYFYNWAFSHAATQYWWKWDGDMVLTEEGERSFEDLKWQLEGLDAVITIPRFPVYVESERVAYVDTEMVNREAWAWPNGEQTFFVKSFEWELPLWPEGLSFLRLPEWTCFELKWLDADEFAHWSKADFSQTTRTSRKAREWEVFHAVSEGRVPFGVKRVESPEGKHVIDQLRDPASATLVFDR